MEMIVAKQAKQPKSLKSPKGLKEKKKRRKHLKAKPPMGVLARLRRLVDRVRAPRVEGQVPAQAPVLNRSGASIRDGRYYGLYNKSVADWMSEQHDRVVFYDVSWMGIKTVHNVLDVWVYQEIIHQTRPEVIIEIGSLCGGLTTFFANMLDLVGGGTVISIDVDRSAFQATHPRIVTLTGDSGSPEIVAQAKEIAAGKRTMVLHDGDHKREAVYRDLVLYTPLVTSGQYFIVEDGVVDIFDPNHSRLGKRWEGPVPAIKQFLASHPEFKVDYNRERYDITYNPYGYLLRT